MHRHEGQRLSLPRCRVAGVALLFLPQPNARRRETERPTLFVLFDGTESMAIEDRWSAADRRALATAVGIESADLGATRQQVVGQWLAGPGNVVAELARRGEPAADEVEEAMRLRLPEPVRETVELHVVEGDPAAAIESAAELLGAGCIVMGEHSKSFLRRWLTPDVSRALLHHAPCPVWYVPAVT